MQRLRRRVLGIGGIDAVPGYNQEDAHIQAVQILSRPQQTADQYVFDGEEYSRQLPQATVLAQAHSQASGAAHAAMAAPVPQSGADR